MSIRRYLAAVTGAAVVAIAFTAPSASAVEGNMYENVPNGCLDGSLSGGITLKPCNSSSNYQRWTLDSTALLRNAHYGAACLDGSLSQGIRLEYCDTGSPYQKWTRSGAEFRSNAYAGYCLDRSVSQGFRLAECNGSKFQKWSKLLDA